MVGTGTAEALLEPPASADVLVTRAERTLAMGGQRRLWRDRGWPPVAASIHVTQRFDDGGGDRGRIGPASYRAPPPPVVVSNENGSGPRPSANSCS